MNEQMQIVYMQARLLLMASERWAMPIDKTARIFEKYGIAELIEDGFDIYHTEGDECVYADILTLLDNQGALRNDRVE